ncbi:MAG: AMP-binding protein [Planctomycetota bacterium]
MIPLTRPALLRERPFAFVAQDAKLSRIYFSGGTLGRPTMHPYTSEDWEAACERTARAFRYTGIKAGDSVAVLHPFDIWSIGPEFVQALAQLGATVLPIGIHLSEETICGLLHRHPVTALCAAPGHLCRIVNAAAKTGHPLPPVQWIIVSGEPVTAAQRAYLHQFLGGEVFSLYGCSELDTLACECAAHNGLHLIADDLYIEVLDPSSQQPVAEGETGEIVVTSQRTQAMPLVRFAIGDLVRLVAGGCLCGTDSPRIEILGRGEERVPLGDGTDLSAFQISAVLEPFCDEILDWQVLLSGPPERVELQLLVAFNEAWSTDVLQAIESRIRKASVDLEDCLAASIIAVCRVSPASLAELERTGRGKRKWLIDNRTKS